MGERAAEASTKADDLHASIQDIQADVAAGDKILNTLSLQLQEFDTKMGRFADDTINMGCGLRKYIIQVMKLNAKDIQSTKNIAKACTSVANLLSQFNWNIINDVHIIKLVVDRTHELFDLVKQLGGRLLQTFHIFQQVKNLIEAWAGKLKTVSADFYDTVEEDLVEMKECLKQLGLHTMLAARSLCRQFLAPTRQEVASREAAFGKTALDSLREQAEALSHMIGDSIVGDDGLTTIEKIEEEAQNWKDDVTGIYDEVIGWYNELTRGFDWKDVLTLGIDRAVDATGLAIESINGLCRMPGLMSDVSNIVQESFSLVPKIKQHWEDLWHRFVDTTRSLCTYLMIPFAEHFADKDSGEDVRFSVKDRNFLTVCEHFILNSSCDPCFAGSYKMCGVASNATVRLCTRKYAQLRYSRIAHALQLSM